VSPPYTTLDNNSIKAKVLFGLGPQYTLLQWLQKTFEYIKGHMRLDKAQMFTL
jgi:hypothetical protein